MPPKTAASTHLRQFASIQVNRCYITTARLKTSKMMGQDIKLAKSELRAQIKTKYSHIHSGDVSISSESANVFSSICESRTYKNATKIGCYLSMPGAEVQTDELVRHALSHGKRVFVPYLYRPNVSSNSSGDTKAGKSKRRVMELLELHGLQDYGALGRDSWGIPTLDPASVAERWNTMGCKGTSDLADTTEFNGGEGRLDLLVVPGVAFDADGRRLGHGAGFYDRFLQAAEQSEGGTGECGLKVGVCLSGQFLATGTIPIEDSDWSMDAVVVGDGRIFTADKIEL